MKSMASRVVDRFAAAPGQVLLWIPERTQGSITVPYTGPKPVRVWSLIRERDESNPPQLPYSPVYRVNAAIEDAGHDWRILPGVFRYSSNSTDGACWLLLEFA